MPDAFLGVLGSALTFAGVITGFIALDPDAAPPGFTTGSDSGTISTSWATLWCFTSAGLGKSISLSLVGPVFGSGSDLLNGDRDRFLVLGLGFGTWRTSVVITSLVGWSGSGSSECQYQPKRQLPGPTPGGGVEGGANGSGGVHLAQKDAMVVVHLAQKDELMQIESKHRARHDLRMHLRSHEHSSIQPSHGPLVMADLGCHLSSYGFGPGLPTLKAPRH